VARVRETARVVEAARVAGIQVNGHANRDVAMSRAGELDALIQGAGPGLRGA
jgi:hypothetical protein